MNRESCPSVNFINLSNLHSGLTFSVTISLVFCQTLLWTHEIFINLLLLIHLCILCVQSQAEFPPVLVVQHDIGANIVISYLCSLVGHYYHKCYQCISSLNISEPNMDKVPYQIHCYHLLFSDDRTSRLKLIVSDHRSNCTVKQILLMSIRHFQILCICTK